MKSLREELRDLKGYQFRLLSIAGVITGFLLSLARLGLDRAPLGLLSLRPGQAEPPMPPSSLYLLPLVVIVPSWWIFFDKTKTITRIVGYYRILEAILSGSEAPQTLIGWERALGRFREQNAAVVKRLRGSRWGRLDLYSRLRRVFLTLSLIQSQRYWTLAYGTFLILSWICLWVPVRSYAFAPHDLLLLLHWHSWSAESSLILVSLLVTSYCMVFNGIVLYRLMWGQHSYDFMERVWKVILNVRPMSDPSGQLGPTLGNGGNKG